MCPKNRSDPQAPSSLRVTGLDAARALAIFGMVIVNVGAPADLQGLENLVVSVTQGRAAILFIVLAGIGFTFLARSTTSRGAALWPSVLWRTGLLLTLGLGLQLLPVGVNVILTLYGGLFLMALITVKWSNTWLLIGATVSLVAGPLVYLLLSTTTDLSTDPAQWGQNPVEIGASVMFTGPYPLIVWAAPFMFGMWLGRLDLRARTTQLRLIAYGAIVAGSGTLISRGLIWILGEPDRGVLGLDHLILSSGHSEMPLWLISAAGSSALIIGLMLILIPKLGALSRPLTATGQLALTCYSLHLVAIAVFVRPEASDPNQSVLVSLSIIAVLVVFSTAWRAVAARGPLESLLRLPSLRRR